jgi:hypothetical protein
MSLDYWVFGDNKLPIEGVNQIASWICLTNLVPADGAPV